MIQLRFNTMAGIDPSIVGPAPFFRIDGLLLRQGPEGQVVGRYHDHHWEVHGSFASSYECTDRISVCFEDGGGRVTKRYGPFQQLLFPNGSCYADTSGQGQTTVFEPGQNLDRGAEVAALRDTLEVHPMIAAHSSD